MQTTPADTATLDASVELTTTITPGGDAGTTTNPDTGAAQEPAPPAPDLWTTPDPVWVKDPAKVVAADLVHVLDRRRLSGPALLRDALALGRVRRANANLTGGAKWMIAATGYGERRLQQFRQVADALDGLTPGVMVEGVVPSPDGLTEPPARWMEVGFDGALEEVLDLLQAVRDAEVATRKAEEKAKADLLVASEAALSLEERTAKELAVARAQVGGEAWEGDAAVVVEALTSHPVLADEVVDGMVGALVRGVHALEPDVRLATLQRAEKAIRVAIRAAKAEVEAAKEAARKAAERAEADAKHLDDVVDGDGGVE